MLYNILYNYSYVSLYHPRKRKIKSKKIDKRKRKENIKYYKTKVWTDFRVRVRTKLRYSSSIIISLQREREHVTGKSHDMMS